MPEMGTLKAKEVPFYDWNFYCADFRRPDEPSGRF